MTGTYAYLDEFIAHLLKLEKALIRTDEDYGHRLVFLEYRHP